MNDNQESQIAEVEVVETVPLAEAELEVVEYVVEVSEEVVEDPEDTTVEEDLSDEPLVEVEVAPVEEVAPFIPFEKNRPAGRRADECPTFYIERTDANSRAYERELKKETILVRGGTKAVVDHHLAQAKGMDLPEIYLAIGEEAKNTTAYKKNELDEVAYRPTAHFQNILEYGGKKFGTRKRGVAEVSGSGPLKGAEAIAHMSAVTGTGGVYSHYLWASGVSLSFATPTLAAELELDAKIALDKTLIGRQTRGTIFANDSFLITRHLIKFIFEHVTMINVEGAHTYEGFINTIRLPDLGIMALMLASQIHKSGFPFAQPCVANPRVCNHISTRLVNILKMLVTDSTYISSKQRALITRNSKISKAELEEYHREFTYPEEVLYHRINDKCRVYFKVPTIAQHLECGERWLAELEQRIEEEFTNRLNDAEFIRFGDFLADADALRNLGHWVESVEIDDGVNVSTITDRQAIEEQLGIWISTDSVSSPLLAALLKYQQTTMVSYAGILNYPCPSCGEMLPTEDGEPNIYYPVDAIGIFFQILR